MPAQKRKASSFAAEAKFLQRLEELGAVLLEDRFLGGSTPHRVRCRDGHDCSPRPSNVNLGQGICRRCGNRQSDRHPSRDAEARFLRDLGVAGAMPLYVQWRGVDFPHHVRCPVGHDCYPRPWKVNTGVRICRICSGLDPATAEARFRRTLSDLGATPVFDVYRGVHEPHAAICRAGHRCAPRPGDLAKGQGICLTCAGQDPAVAEARFRAQLAKAGASALFGEWGGANRAHHVRCAQGHDCWPYPSNVRRGEGICRKCGGRAWDAFYVVASSLIVKFGITSGDPWARLGVHARSGFTDVVLLATRLPGRVAPDAERAVRSALDLARECPVKGNEYFDVSCTGLIVDVAGAWVLS